MSQNLQYKLKGADCLSQPETMEVEEEDGSLGELTEDGLSVEGLSQVQSISSAILDEDESDCDTLVTAKLLTNPTPDDESEDDDVNVTIRPLNKSGDKKKNLTRYERRRLKALRSAGLTREVALQQLSTSQIVTPGAPKRPRRQDTGSSGEKPSLKRKKVALCPKDRAGVTKPPVQLEQGESSGKGSSLAKSEVTKQGSSKQKGKASHSDSSRANAGSNKQKKAPLSYKDVVSQIKIGVMTEDFPNTEMTTNQLDALQEALLVQIEEQYNDSVKPKFSSCLYKLGYMVLVCKDQATADWVKRITPTIKPWENAKLVALDEHKIPRRERLHAFFPQSASFSDDRLKRIIQSQNEELSVENWRILQRSNTNTHAEWTLIVDEVSLRKLKERDFILNFRFGETRLRLVKSTPQKKPEVKQNAIAKTDPTSKGSSTATEKDNVQTTAEENSEKPESSGGTTMASQEGSGNKVCKSAMDKQIHSQGFESTQEVGSVKAVATNASATHASVPSPPKCLSGREDRKK